MTFEETNEISCTVICPESRMESIDYSFTVKGGQEARSGLKSPK